MKENRLALENKGMSTIMIFAYLKITGCTNCPKGNKP